MIVDNFQLETIREKTRLSAKMVWEDCDRPANTIYFETDKRFSDAFTDSANAFLLSCAIPAMHFGEQRLRIKGEICPELNTGMSVVLDWFRYWYDQNDKKKFTIDANLQKKQKNINANRRAGFFFSGGIDSYSVLCNNRRDFSPQHPGFIKDGIVIFGLELDQEEKFKHVLSLLKKGADAFNFQLIPVFTNIYLIYREEDKQSKFSFWNHKFHSAALTAVVHALDNRLHTALLGSTHDIPNLIPHGTHPVIEPNYSSSLLRVKYDGVNLSRFEKTEMVSRWKDATRNLRVCNHAHKYEDGQLNCGICDKCVRTALALEALGRLKGSQSFPYERLEVGTVNKAFRYLNDVSAMFLLELIEPLKKANRYDLAQAVRDHWINYHQKKSIGPFSQRILKQVMSLFKKGSTKTHEKLLV